MSPGECPTEGLHQGDPSAAPKPIISHRNSDTPEAPNLKRLHALRRYGPEATSGRTGAPMGCQCGLWPMLPAYNSACMCRGRPAIRSLRCSQHLSRTTRAPRGGVELLDRAGTCLRRPLRVQARPWAVSAAHGRCCHHTIAPACAEAALPSAHSGTGST